MPTSRPAALKTTSTWPNAKRRLSFIGALTLGLLSGQTANAQTTPVSGYITRLEVHVGAAHVRFRVSNAPGDNGGHYGQYVCGSSLEAYFPLAASTVVGTYTYTQTVIDALRSSVYLARASQGQVDVYTVPDGASCVVTDIVVR